MLVAGAYLITQFFSPRNISFDTLGDELRPYISDPCQVVNDVMGVYNASRMGTGKN
jgi:hypothetical protein